MFIPKTSIIHVVEVCQCGTIRLPRAVLETFPPGTKFILNRTPNGGLRLTPIDKMPVFETTPILRIVA